VIGWRLRDSQDTGPVRIPAEQVTGDRGDRAAAGLPREATTAQSLMTWTHEKIIGRSRASVRRVSLVDRVLLDNGVGLTKPRSTKPLDHVIMRLRRTRLARADHSAGPPQPGVPGTPQDRGLTHSGADRQTAPAYPELRSRSAATSPLAGRLATALLSHGAPRGRSATAPRGGSDDERTTMLLDIRAAYGAQVSHLLTLAVHGEQRERVPLALTSGDTSTE